MKGVSDVDLVAKYLSLLVSSLNMPVQFTELYSYKHQVDLIFISLQNYLIMLLGIVIQSVLFSLVEKSGINILSERLFHQFKQKTGLESLRLPFPS